MSIPLEIAEWDGKSAYGIAEIFDRHHQDGSFVSGLIKLVGNSSSQKGATWLLKRYLESKGKISSIEVNGIFGALADLEGWESKLHILQCLPFLGIGKSNKIEVESFLRDCLTGSNKFVRAWAYNGFYELAVQYPEYEKEAKQFFEMAMRDEAPSVKARIRNIMKKGF